MTDYDNDAIAELVREALGDVTLHDAAAQWVLTYCPEGRAITAVNIVTSPRMHQERVREALEVALLQVAEGMPEQ